MTKEHYDSIGRCMAGRPQLLKLIRALNRLLPVVMYAAYPLLLVYLAATRDERFYRVLIVPAVVFISVTLLRKIINFPRPYEKLPITPLIAREGSGQSFPSRHASSAAVIAIAFWYIWPPAGIAMALITLVIAGIRLIAAIHFPRDVIAGIMYSLILGIMGFWVI